MNNGTLSQAFKLSELRQVHFCCSGADYSTVFYYASLCRVGKVVQWKRDTNKIFNCIISYGSKYETICLLKYKPAQVNSSIRLFKVIALCNYKYQVQKVGCESTTFGKTRHIQAQVLTIEGGWEKHGQIN